jgi:hypothetical protein
LIERWNHEETEHREQFLRQAYVSVDPGADGYAMLWLPGATEPSAYCHALEPEALTALLIRGGVNVLVVEGQYVRSLKNARHVLELAFRQAMAIGWLAAVLHSMRIDLHLFQVAPSTWQAYRRRQAGLKGHAERGEGIELALQRAEQVIGKEREWVMASKKQKEGMASAFCIGEWWRSLTWKVADGA